MKKKVRLSNDMFLLANWKGVKRASTGFSEGCIYALKWLLDKHTHTCGVTHARLLIALGGRHTPTYRLPPHACMVHVPHALYSTYVQCKRQPAADDGYVKPRGTGGASGGYIND